jgi:ribonucleoside-diphosphate reductase alpha chain
MSKQQMNETHVSDESEVSTPILSVDESLDTEERLTNNAVENILPSRYLLDDETPDDMFWRVADNVATAEYAYNNPDGFETWRDEFYDIMSTLRFMPNSPTLMNAGGDLQQLSACFVLEVGDSMTQPDENGRTSILESAKDAGQIFKSGGGVGYTFGFLRPKGTHIESTDSETSGPMQFMRLFDEVCNTVKQGGKRRGAQMAIMPIHHPDIGRFAVAKREEGAFSNFNISVGVTDDFIEAVEDDDLYELKDPRTDFDETFEIVEATKNFFAPSAEDSPEAVVDENIWRDHADTVEAWDWENDETVSFRDKWHAHFEAAEAEGNLDAGEKLALPARFIWDLVIDGAWRNGEPGLFYLEETNRQHSFDVDEHPEYEIHATNPCFTGDTLISTGNGLKRADELYESGTAVDVTVDSRLSDERSQEASSVYVTGEKDVYKLTTSEGYEIRVTADHQFKTGGGWVEVQNLESGDTVHIVDREGQFGSHGSEALGASMGWLVGDGHIHQGDEAAVLNFYDEDSTVSGQFSEFVTKEVRPAMNGQHDVGVKQIRSGEQRIKSTRLYELADEMGLVDEKLQVPKTIMAGSSDMASAFLRALFTADGHVENTEKSKAVVLSSKSESMLKDVQRLLLNFGIYSTIYTNRKEAGKTEIKGEEYDREALHGLHITKESLEVYQESIGFYRDDKSEQLDELLGSYTRGPYSREFEATVESIEADGHETVYDLTEPETNSLVGNGFVIHNCAEQPLCNYEACNLGHINLSLMVREDAPDYENWREVQDHDYYNESSAVVDYLNESIDYEELDRVIESGVRFLDNVIEMSEFPLDEIDETVEDMRKIGLGVMGWAQMLYQLGIPYGSDESYTAAEHVMSYIDAKATRASHELAEERGVFESWEESKYADPTEYTEWFEDHAYVSASEYEDGYELRNHNVTTVAPTGTTSMIADTSGGIEPVYNVAYKKNVGNDIQGAEKLVEFDSYFLNALEANGIDVEDVKEEAARLMDENSFESVQDLETVPDGLKDVFVTTNDLSSEQHGLMQRAFQKAVDSGISKTVNLPNEATHADVHDAYMLAVSDDDIGAPIKGLTVYRDGSREEQVLSTGESTEKELEAAKETLEQAGYTVEE